MNDHKTGTVDVEFFLKNGKVLPVYGIDITVWDALRKSETEEYSKKAPNSSSPFTKQFIWGDDSGVRVEDISGYTVVSRN